MISAWLAAFVFTQIVEVPIYLVALARVPRPASRLRDIFVAFGASTLTHPLLWLLFPKNLSPHAYYATTAIAEVIVVLVEAAWLRLFGVRRAIVWSIVANGASFGLGTISRALFGIP